MRTTLAAICLALIVAAAVVAQPQGSEAATTAEIDRDANNTLHSFVDQVPGARELANKASITMAGGFVQVGPVRQKQSACLAPMRTRGRLPQSGPPLSEQAIHAQISSRPKWSRGCGQADSFERSKLLAGREGAELHVDLALLAVADDGKLDVGVRVQLGDLARQVTRVVDLTPRR
jgi:hypothetical protein